MRKERTLLGLILLCAATVLIATNASGAWVTETVDSAGYVGEYTSIAIDPAGSCHISYCDLSSRHLEYATNASGAWVTETVDSAGDVGHTSIATDPSGSCHISYHDWDNWHLKYATNASGAWVTETVDSAGDVGQYTSIATDPSGNCHISYYDYSNFDLKYATNAPHMIDRLMLIRQKLDLLTYKLQLYDVPTTVGGNTSPPFATDNNIGKKIGDIAAGNFDGDGEDELAVVRLKGDNVTFKLQLYDVPTTVGGNTGPPFATDNNIAKNIWYIAAGNFDGDGEDELAVVRLKGDGVTFKLQLYDVPTTVGGNTGPPFATDNNIGKNIRAIAACIAAW